MSNIARFIGVAAVLIIAAFLLLAVGGVLSADQLQHSVIKVVEMAAIVLIASMAVLAFAKK